MIELIGFLLMLPAMICFTMFVAQIDNFFTSPDFLILCSILMIFGIMILNGVFII